MASHETTGVKDDAGRGKLDPFITEALPHLLEVRKVLIALWEKLVILDAAVLTLSLSAATSFRGHTVGDGGVGYLFLSWELLVASIILAALAQVISSVSTKYLAEGALLYQMAVLFSGPGGVGTVTGPKNPSSESKSASTYAKVDDILGYVSLTAGFAAVLLMIVALCYICRFGHTNLTHFLS